MRPRAVPTGSMASERGRSNPGETFESPHRARILQCPEHTPHDEEAERSGSRDPPRTPGQVPDLPGLARGRRADRAVPGPHFPSGRLSPQGRRYLLAPSDRRLDPPDGPGSSCRSLHIHARGRSLDRSPLDLPGRGELVVRARRRRRTQSGQVLGDLRGGVAAGDHTAARLAGVGHAPSLDPRGPGPRGTHLRPARDPDAALPVHLPGRVDEVGSTPRPGGDCVANRAGCMGQLARVIRTGPDPRGFRAD